MIKCNYLQLKRVSNAMCRKHSFVPAAVLSFLCVCLVVTSFPQLHRAGNNAHTNITANNNAPRKKRVLEWDVYQSELSNPADDMDRVLEKSANNIGNWVWNHAASTRLIDFTQVDLIKSLQGTIPVSRFNDQAVDVLFWPTANILLNESYASHMSSFFDEINSAINKINSSHMSVLMLGIGVDFPLEPYPFADIRDLGDRIRRLAFPHEMTMFKPAVDMLREIATTAPVIGSRGDFTAAVCKNHGIEHVEALGCPSLFLSTHPNTGEILARKIRELPANPKIAITLPHLFRPKLYSFFLRVLNGNPESIMVVQDKRDLATIEKAAIELGMRVPANKVRFFYSLEEWKQTICTFDATIGARIHGSMIAFVCPIPMLVIPIDMRVEELATSMKIPHMRMDHPAFFGNHSAITIRDLFDGSGFDADSFDRNRFRQAARYVRHFESMGLPPTPLLRTLASMHVDS